MHYRSSVVAVAALCALSCEHLPTTPAVVRSVVRLDLTSLHGGTGSQPARLSVLERVRLTVDRSPEPVQETTLDPDATDVEFAVVVTAGTVAFAAEIFSNNGQRLYAETVSDRIDSDGFVVTIVPQPMNAVMVVEPAVIDLRTASSLPVTVSNEGNAPLDWTVVAPCDTVVCILVDSDGGTIGAARSQTFQVSGFARSTPPSTALQLTSAVGTIAVPVLTASDATPPAATLTGIPFGSVNPNVRAWVVSYSDPAPSSGFDPAPLRVQLASIRASGVTCYLPDDPFTLTVVACGTSAGTALFQPSDSTISIAASRGLPEGYWQMRAFVVDRAGNASDTLTGLTLVDITPPVAGVIASPASITGGAAVTFSSALVDNVELGDVLGATVFGGAGITLVDSRQTIGAYGVDAIAANSPGTFNIAQFVRSVETTTGAGLPSGTVSPATNFEYAARDVAGVQLNTIVADGCPAAGAADGTTTQNCILRQVDISAAVNLGSNNTFPAYTALNRANAANGLHGLFVHQAPSNAGVCTDASCAAPNNVFNTTLTATLTGPAATFSNPFNQVVFYMRDTNGRWTPIGTASTAVTDDTVLNTRTFTFSFVWTPTGLGDYVAPIVAVGVNANGSALVSQGGSVTLTTT